MDRSIQFSQYTMKNLLFFASDFKIGLSALLTDQLIALHDAEINVTAVAGENEQEPGLSMLLSSKNINIQRINGLDEHREFKRLVNKISEIIKKNDIDLIHVQNNWQLAIASAVKLKSRKNLKIIYTIHGFRNNHPIKSHIAHIVIGTALLMLADNVICTTEFLKQKFMLLSYKIKLIPLGIKDDYFEDSYISPPTDALHMIFPAQFREGKNQDIIIKAFSDFINQTGDKKATLTLPGNGPLLEKMKSLAHQLDIQDRVIFPGFVSKEEIKDLYLKSNIAIVASNSETFGQSIVEPFVLGRCVISTPVGITPEFIKNGINGYIFDKKKDLVNILTNIDINLLNKIGENNFRCRNKFRWKEIAKIYNQLI